MIDPMYAVKEAAIADDCAALAVAVTIGNGACATARRGRTRRERRRMVEIRG